MVHAAVEGEAAEHTVPQAPQLLTSVVRSANVLPHIVPE
jgi:hypothetical protein